MAPELTLLFSPGNTAALPALVAASACGVPFKHAPLDKSSTALLTSAAPFADVSSVLLTGPDGLVLYEPIAIARYIASLTTGKGVCFMGHFNCRHFNLSQDFGDCATCAEVDVGLILCGANVDLILSGACKGNSLNQ